MPDLSAGMLAPDFNSIIGNEAGVVKATVSYSNSVGNSDSFNVGSITNIGATASASSTPDYSVSSNATFALRGDSSFTQMIGAGSSNQFSNDIGGSFRKAFTPDGSANSVDVNGIASNADIMTREGSSFVSDIQKLTNGNLLNSGAGLANGAASGTVGTSTTAGANSSQFVSSFAQAY